MSESLDFAVQKSELTVAVAFDRPLWALLHNVPQLYTPLLEHLSSFGIGAAQLRPENSDGSIAGTSVSIPAFNFGLLTRIRLENFEISCPDLLRIPIQQINPLIAAVSSAVQDADKSIQYKSLALTLHLHGRLNATESRDFLRQFVGRIPSVDASLVGTGAAFYFGPTGERTLLTLTLDLSSLVSEGVFVRSHAVYGGASISDVRSVLAEHLRTTFDVLGLRLSTQVDNK